MACFLISCTGGNKDKLTIATAANLQFVISDLTKAFTENTGIECQAIISSSGKLTAQIEAGAPYDLFLSADMKYPEQLFKNKKTIFKPAVYAFGKLVLWGFDVDEKNLWDQLLDASIRKVAVANPKTAPYGQAAIQVLKNKNYYSQLENKLVFGESIAQTNQFIVSQAAEIGFTSKSVVLSSKLNNKGYWMEIDEELHDPIQQGVVLLQNRESFTKEAQLFVDFLFSSKGKSILEKNGYSTIKAKQ